MTTWLDNDEQPFICIHAPPSTPPTLFFALAPRSGPSIWIELRVSLDSDMVTSTAVKQMFEAMTLDNLFADANNDSACTLVNFGQRPVVRVVAPACASLSDGFTVPECTGGPVAILNMASLDKCVDGDRFPDIICIMKDVLVSITDWVQPKRRIPLNQPLDFYGEPDSSSEFEGDWEESDSEDERSEPNRHREERLQVMAGRNIRV
ncbi:hypothetical protein CPB85DRAFT_431485 [Mucidula mucida]|nr:hypothetical protein CPB85DRAFT_431485 [Mucidula mucida]